MVRRRRARRQTPAQRAASINNLKKARAARAARAKATETKPTVRKKVAPKKALHKATGGTAVKKQQMVTLYHYTNSSAASKIVKEGFHPISRLGMPPSEHVFFMPSRTAKMTDIGLGRSKAIVSVRVPKSIVSSDKFASPSEKGAVKIKLTDLAGVRVSKVGATRRKTGTRRKALT